MSIKLAKLSSILLITATSSLLPSLVKAEEPALSVAEAFENAYFKHTGNNYQNSSFIGQLNTIFGFKGFPDRQISADGKAVDTIYNNVMENQSQVGSPLKTRDLNNPYDTSLIEMKNSGYNDY